MGLDIRRILNQFKDVMLIKSFFFFVEQIWEPIFVFDINETMSHAMQGYPRQMGHSGEF